MNRPLLAVQAHQLAESARSSTIGELLHTLPAAPGLRALPPVPTERMRELVDAAALAILKPDRRRARAGLIQALQMSDYFGRGSAKIFAAQLIAERRREKIQT